MAYAVHATDYLKTVLRKSETIRSPEHSNTDRKRRKMPIYVAFEKRIRIGLEFASGFCSTGDPCFTTEIPRGYVEATSEEASGFPTMEWPKVERVSDKMWKEFYFVELGRLRDCELSEFMHRAE